MRHLWLEGYETECYDADLACYTAVCEKCGKTFAIQGVLSTPDLRYYIAIGDDHIHFMVGGETQI
jgi:hypothetical protein